MGLCVDGRVKTSGIGLGGDDVRKTEEKRGGGGEKEVRENGIVVMMFCFL